MRNIHIASENGPRVLGFEATVEHESATRFTPGDFFKDAGTVIAICLVLGLLMQVLLG